MPTFIVEWSEKVRYIHSRKLPGFPVLCYQDCVRGDQLPADAARGPARGNISAVHAPEHFITQILYYCIAILVVGRYFGIM